MKLPSPLPRTLVLAWALALLGCATNPITGRRQLLLVSEETELQMGAQGYQKILGEVRLSADPAEVEPVRRVARRITEVADRSLQEKGGRRGYAWEVSVVKDDQVANALCLPGGKIVVFTGIFPAAYDEAGLAVILGHEISHALGRHGAERVSQGMAVNLGAAVLAASLQKESQEVVDVTLALYGIGSDVALLKPFSRDHETEADRLGVELAARAGYDPRAGIQVWERMEKLSAGGPPEFLSTHPSHETRIQNMRDWMDEVRPLYERSRRWPVEKLPVGLPAQKEVPPISVPVRAAGARRAPLQKGQPPTVAFEFEFAREAFVQQVEIQGPEGPPLTLDVRSAVPGQRTLEVRSPSLPDGHYEVRFRGRRNGRPFESKVPYLLSSPPRR